MIELAEVTVKLVAGVVAKSTALAPVNPVPLTSTLVPPEVGPVLGKTALTVVALT